MTRECAVEMIKAIKNGLHETGKDFPYRDEIIPIAKEALDMAIDELEQEPILDKIRAEIMQLDYDTDYVDYDSNDLPQTETLHTIYREEVLQIIDKYKEKGRIS